jgi:membrane protein implicated in regulation of membrane protease activity
MTFVWLAAALAFGVAEMLTLAFFALFFVVGALAAAVAAWLGLSEVGQIVVFAVVSIVGVVAARPPMMHYLKERRGTPEVLSGAEAMIGRDATVVDDILDEHHPGHVLIAGERWLAIPADGRPISSGSTVRIERLRQSRLVVSPVTPPPSTPPPGSRSVPAEPPAPSATPKE